MDCKILMIGDWVVLKSNGVQPDTKIRITELSTEGGFVDDCDNFIGYEELDPIPLTEEILVKNGWFALDEYRYEGDVALAKESSGFRLKNTDICVKSVHQLQHLLRLCGIEKEIEL